MSSRSTKTLPSPTGTARIACLCAAALLTLTACEGGRQVDAVVIDYPIAYVKRPIPAEQGDIRQSVVFNPGGDLFMRELAAPGAEEINLTGRLTGGKGDVKDVEVSYRGGKLLFAMRLPDPVAADDSVTDQDEQSIESWNIWEYEIATDQFRRIIADDELANAGDDVSPAYLPDGRIVFASSRVNHLHDNLRDPGPALALYVINADGSDIHQISLGQNIDIHPSILQNGNIVFSRWEHFNRWDPDVGDDAVNLYSIRPDGTGLQMWYGAHSHETFTEGTFAQFLKPKLTPGGRLVSVARPLTGTWDGGQIVLINSESFADHDQPTADNMGLVSGPGQIPATSNQVHTDILPSPGGRFRSAYPLWDGTSRLLVSWSPCRLVENGRIVPCTGRDLTDPLIQEALPLYGVWIYDVTQRSQLPVLSPQEGILYEEVVPIQPRPTPPVVQEHLAGTDLNQSCIDEGVGLLHIRSVYDFDGHFNAMGSPVPSLEAMADPLITTANRRPARFVRIVAGVPIPPKPHAPPAWAFGPFRSNGMRQIVGYLPIEPDGSVLAKVPANVPLTIDVLDDDAQRITPRHQTWVEMRPGETLQCIGCHDHSTGIPHGREGTPFPINQGAPTDGPFPNTRLYAYMGETMAQTNARLNSTGDCVGLSPTADVHYLDVWTDPEVRQPFESFSYLYSDLVTPSPANDQCTAQWDSSCRTVINYPEHIQPLWDLNRVVDGEERTCVRCHNDAGGTRIPPAQLDLTDQPAEENEEVLKSFRQLLFKRYEMELVNGTIRYRTQMVCSTDEEGNPILDELGNCVLVEEPVTLQPPMSAHGAQRSRAFFRPFRHNGVHEGWLSDAELRLLFEWLDGGGQFYNDPADVR